MLLFLFVLSGIRKNENGVPEDEENFEEAIKNVNTALNPTKVPQLRCTLSISHFCSHRQSCNVSYFCRFLVLLKTSLLVSSVKTSQHRL